jgi:hypothetical protein
LFIGWGIQGYWATGDPAFGVVAPSATSGYEVHKYNVEGSKYSLTVKPFAGTVPAWGTALIS